MSDEWKLGVVYVCPERDIECGSFERNWCANCPKRRATPPSPSTAPTVEVDELPPIEYDKALDRTYIPLPGGWEIQTKGNGSTFRIAQIGSRTRWMVLDDNLHEPLEALARDMRNAIASKPPAREAAERQSIGDDETFHALLAYVMVAAKNFTPIVEQAEKINALIAHIDTWGGAAPAAGNTEPEE